MGQKVHPVGFRLGINKTWVSRSFAEKDYSKLLQEDIYIRKFSKEEALPCRSGPKLKLNG